MIKKLSFVFLILVTLHGCTRDDICAETTQTTPLLIVTFKNRAIPTEAKPANGLTIETTLENSKILLKNETIDSIAIPLNVGANFTTYRFTINSDSIPNLPNSDILEFRYEREDIYVNRACSFKTIYNNLEANLEDEGANNWISRIKVNALNNTVKDENETHITILH